MKIIPGENRSMSEPTPVTKMQVLAHPTMDAAQAARAEPLRIDYSTTRVLPDVIGRVQRLPGVVTMDRSELAESFKMLRNQLRQRMRADDQRVLAVTSARHIRGKSITALNVALSLAADLDTAVLLVDADLSTTGLQRLFGLDGTGGLADYLRDSIPVPELLVNPGVDRFVFLPAGSKRPDNSAELLATRAARHLMAEMKQRYADRTIVVDLPALLDTADALAFLPQVDTTLVVVEDHGTTMPDLEQVAELMAPYNLVGTVVSRPPEPEDSPPRRGLRRWFRGHRG